MSRKIEKKGNRRTGILFAFVIVIPIVICLAELGMQFAIVQMIKDAIATSPDAIGNTLGMSMLDSILSVISIAVSVWIGLNIYNVYKKEDTEEVLAKVENATSEMLYEGERRKFIWNVEKGEYMYEICRYLADQFELVENIPIETMTELTYFEKRLYWVYNAYENKRYHESNTLADNLLLELPNFRKILSKLGDPDKTIVSSYLNIRESDLLFYKNSCSAKPSEKDYIKSIELYKQELENIPKDNLALRGYMENTIGYTYRLLCSMGGTNDKKDSDTTQTRTGYRLLRLACFWKNRDKDNKEEADPYSNLAKEYMTQAVKHNPKGRYYQNLGSYYELIAKDYDLAMEMYKKAYKAEKRDNKIYNLIGALLLKKVNAELHIDVRFQNNLTLPEIDRSSVDKVRSEIDAAYEWLSYALKLAEPIVNAYYNYGRACLYYWLFIDDTKSNKYEQAESVLHTLEIIWKDSENHLQAGYLFLRRDMYEAKGNYEKALEINADIHIGDSAQAESVYKTKINDPGKHAGGV